MHRSSEKLNFGHFADDTTVYMSGCDLNQLCEEVSIELGNVEEWMRANRLSLNVQKTSFMVFTHRQIKREDLVIEIGGMTSLPCWWYESPECESSEIFGSDCG